MPIGINILMRMSKARTGVPALRLKEGAIERLKSEFKTPSDTALAAHVGIHQGQYSRVMNKRGQPGAAFIARFLAAMQPHDLDFYDLFELVQKETAA